MLPPLALREPARERLRRAIEVWKRGLTDGSKIQSSGFLLFGMPVVQRLDELSIER